MDITNSDMEVVNEKAEHECESSQDPVPATADNSETDHNAVMETPTPASDGNDACVEVSTLNGKSKALPDETDQTVVIDRRGALSSSSGTEDSSSDTESICASSDKQKDLEDDVQIIKVESADGEGLDAHRSIVCYDSSTSSSSDEEDILAVMRAQNAASRKANQAKGPKQPTTEGEILPENLPAIEELSLEVNTEVELKPLGSVSSIVDNLVVVQSLHGSPGLDCDSIIFREDRTAIGRVFDLFGPVVSPYYSIRFNSRQHAIDCGIYVGMNVFYAPGNLDFSKFVLLTELRKHKGSDASWRNDNEPPAMFLDYSDDETEKREKRKLRGSKAPDDGDSETSAPRTAASGRRKTTAKRVQPRGSAPTRPGWSRPPFVQRAPLRIGDWRSRPPPPMEGWARAPPQWGGVSHPNVPPPCFSASGHPPWFAATPPSQLNQQRPWNVNAPSTGPRSPWNSPGVGPPHPPIFQASVPADLNNPSSNLQPGTQQPPIPDPSDPQFRELFTKYFDYYSSYYQGQPS